MISIPAPLPSALPPIPRACTAAGSEQKAAPVGGLFQFGQACNVGYWPHADLPPKAAFAPGI